MKQVKRLFEYTLILAFVALASAALFMDACSSVTNIWTKANTTLSPCNPGVELKNVNGFTYCND